MTVGEWRKIRVIVVFVAVAETADVMLSVTVDETDSERASFVQLWV